MEPGGTWYRDDPILSSALHHKQVRIRHDTGCEPAYTPNKNHELMDHSLSFPDIGYQYYKIGYYKCVQKKG